MNGNSGHVDRDVKKLSYREYVKTRYANAVVLARQMEKILGKDRAHEIIRDAFYNDMTDMVKEELEEQDPVNKFADFVRLEKDENEQPNFKNIVELKYPHELDTELSLNVSRCLYARDYAQANHPRIKLRRSETFMEGHSCCNHVWYWEDE
jgi:hypothetical protein